MTTDDGATNDIAALIQRGAALLGEGDAAAARRAFNLAINEDPTVAAAWIMSGSPKPCARP